MHSGEHYEYAIADTNIKVNNTIDIIFNLITKEKLDTLISSKISGYKQEVGRITIYAWGDKPTIDLDYSLVVRGGF